MKILNWNVNTQEFTVSMQKHKDVDNIVKVLAQCDAIINIYECDLFYKNKKILNVFKSFFMKYSSLMNITQNFMNNIPKKSIKHNCMGLSMDIQRNMSQLFIEINKANINEFDISNTNHIIIAALANETLDKLMTDYLEKHDNDILNYAKIQKEFLEKHTSAKKRQCIMLANKVDLNKVFPHIENPKEYKFSLQTNNLLLNRKGFLRLNETTNIPILVSDLLPYSMWGFHLFYEQKHLKYFIFYCFNDIVIFSYRKGSAGLTKLDFYVAIPEINENDIDKDNLDLEEYNQHISKFLNSYLEQHNKFVY